MLLHFPCTNLLYGIDNDVIQYDELKSIHDYILENTVFNVVGMMRWQEPLDNIYHLTNRINNKDRISLYYADLNDAGSVRNMIEKVQPRYISHLAAQSYPKTSFDIPIETLQTNIIGTANLLEAVRHTVNFTDPFCEYPYDPVVHICSSSEVFGKVERKNNDNSTIVVLSVQSALCPRSAS